MPGFPSSIHRLPKNVREALHGWLNDPGITQTEAAERVNAMLAEVAPEHPRVSRKAVNRYDQKYRVLVFGVREPPEAVSRMVADLRSGPGGEAGLLILAEADLAEIVRRGPLIALRVTNREKNEASGRIHVDGAARPMR